MIVFNFFVVMPSFHYTNPLVPPCNYNVCNTRTIVCKWYPTSWSYFTNHTFHCHFCFHWCHALNKMWPFLVFPHFLHEQPNEKGLQAHDMYNISPKQCRRSSKVVTMWGKEVLLQEHSPSQDSWHFYVLFAIAVVCTLLFRFTAHVCMLQIN